MFTRATWFILCLASFISSACGWQSPKNSAPPGTVWLDSKEVHESSGLARSRRVERLLWTHNDSGDESRLFAFDADGRLHAIVDIKDTDSVDWEDMCSFQWKDRPYLAIADVGDNGIRRKHVTIYGLKEPEIKLKPVRAEGKEAKPDKIKVEVDFEIKVKYPGGPTNCEAIAYDPWRRQFLLASKEQLQSRLFAVSFDPRDHKQECTAELIGTFPVPIVTGRCCLRRWAVAGLGHLWPDLFTAPFLGHTYSRLAVDFKKG